LIKWRKELQGDKSVYYVQNGNRLTNIQFTQANRLRNMRAALWICHHYDVIRFCDVIDHVTIWLSIDNFLYVLNRNQTVSHLVVMTSSLTS